MTNTLNEELKIVKRLEKNAPKDARFLYVNENWLRDYPLTQSEKENGRVSQYRLLHYLFSNIILANTLCENLIKQSYETCSMDELISPYNEETEEYEDEYQYFIVGLALDEETTIKAIKNCVDDWYLRYDNENDIYILSIGNLGTSREIISTDAYLTNDCNKRNIYD